MQLPLIGPSISEIWVEDKRATVNRSLRLRWHLESERAPLIQPGHWQVDETLETIAARQASFDCRLDDLRREESKRQGHPNRTRSSALPRSKRLQVRRGLPISCGHPNGKAEDLVTDFLDAEGQGARPAELRG
jgi:hypothetical protein